MDLCNHFYGFVRGHLISITCLKTNLIIQVFGHTIEERNGLVCVDCLRRIIDVEQDSASLLIET